MSGTAQALPAISFLGLAAATATEGNVTVVALRGEADLSTLDVLEEALSDAIAHREGDVVVDLAQADFIDTAALRAILRARATVDGNGHQLTLRSPSRIARRLLGIFGLGHLAGLHVSTKGKEPQ